MPCAVAHVGAVSDTRRVVWQKGKRSMTGNTSGRGAKLLAVAVVLVGVGVVR